MVSLGVLLQESNIVSILVLDDLLMIGWAQVLMEM